MKRFFLDYSLQVCKAFAVFPFLFAVVSMLVQPEWKIIKQSLIIILISAVFAGGYFPLKRKLYPEDKDDKSMLVFGKIIGVLGKIYLVLAFFVISASLIMIFLKKGFGEIQMILNPFNIWNFIVTALTLLPGMGLLKLSEKIKEKYETRTNSAEDE